MSKVTQSELQEIKSLIEGLNQKIDHKFEQLEDKVDNLEKGQLKLEGKLERLEGKIEAWKPAFDKIPDLAEKVGELKNWRSIALVIISGVITTLFWFFRNGKL